MRTVDILTAVRDFLIALRSGNQTRIDEHFSTLTVAALISPHEFSAVLDNLDFEIEYHKTHETS